METTTFGRTGLKVSRIGFGAAEVGFLQTEREKVARILGWLLDNGVNFIDTAANYLGSEELIGQTIADRRGKYVLLSKCGTKLPDLEGEAWSRELVARAVDRSLRRLKTDHLDVMLLHSCDLATLKKGDALRALLDAQKAGKVRFVGYSGDNEAAAWAAARPEVQVLETSVSICDQANISLALPVASLNNAGVIAKRPIANAAWRAQSEQPGFYGDYARDYHDRLRAMKLVPADLGFAGDAHKSWPELALRFTLSQPVHTLVVGTTKPENAKRNLEAVAKGPLTEDVLHRIHGAFRQAEMASGMWWEGQT